MRRFVPLLILAGFGWVVPRGVIAEVIDRVAISVGNQAVTESKLRLEVRLEAFFNGKPVDFGPAQLRQAARRLVDQMLVKREMELGGYPPPSEEEIAQFRKNFELAAGGESAFEENARRSGLDMETIQRFVAWTAALNKFIELRFRPAVHVSEEDVRAYLQEHPFPGKTLEERMHSDEVRAAAEKTLGNNRTDQLVERWLAEGRKQTIIEYPMEALR